ncbi:NAD(P)-binding domain-containing protein [Streptomyces sp. CC224B]|uniref:NAD(P)-binding domain-containing protein n=1 Tax=Streptomyces sp. CC224B TaxID=3044571 RepID=UPI0024A9A34C|nr:NAD(P)-binding domain-containing protein [Streptomyces sp. CC224B]
MERIDVAVSVAARPDSPPPTRCCGAGARPVVVEATGRAAGLWPCHDDSLTLFSPVRYGSLPGMPFPGADRDRYRHRDEVVAHLTAYADRLDAEVRTGCRVSVGRRTGGGFEVEVEGGDRLSARAAVAASGAFGCPHRPTPPGLEEFTGQVPHADYRGPASFTGRRVVVAGASNSAVQIAAQLAETARVTLATRAPVQFAAQRALGRNPHWRLTHTGLDATPLGRLLSRPPTQPVLDDGVGVRLAGPAAQLVVALAAPRGPGRGPRHPPPGRPPRAPVKGLPVLVRRVST